MFLETTRSNNTALIKAAIELHKQGAIMPDTYVLDYDSLMHNARLIKQQADNYGISLYFMTKQFGRNPYIAARLMELGYEGAVAVEYKEAKLLAENGIKLGHVGHLSQIPSHGIIPLLKQGVDIVTVYSVEKAQEISRAAGMLDIKQKVMLRVLGSNDVLYPGQYGGFTLDKLPEAAEKIASMNNIDIDGLTSFPCFLFDVQKQVIQATPNVDTINEANEILKGKLGINISQLNMPSATCSNSIPLIAAAGGTHGEPGHGLLGTTPLHAAMQQPETPSIVYLSEVSHQLGNVSYCYGGGYYPRSHMENALVGKSFDSMQLVGVEKVKSDSIDYYIGLKCRAEIGDTVLFAFRAQIFVTRSTVAVVKGIHGNTPQIIGIYDSLGHLLKQGETFE
ncbi:YhfX family PLP-dependent enzyme [Pectinatus frisingensis]|uniref:YhfX family PLP-dependent enzyme n=1 Tax=Pectinatus frisingensis TaxID=865 RepID=UPI003D807844